MSKVFAVVTSTRADYGLLVPLLRALSHADGIVYRLIVTGTHLSEQHSLTKNQIYKDDYVVAEEVPCLADRGEEPTTAVTASRALYRIASVFSRIQPDAVILPGDRYEIMASAIAASLCRIPIVHLHGGEVTEGAYDEGFRHAISKLSHIHLTATEEYRVPLKNSFRKLTKWRCVPRSFAPAVHTCLNFFLMQGGLSTCRHAQAGKSGAILSDWRCVPRSFAPAVRT